ncbi:MAG TPA: hypothetical protein VMV63_02545, partial [Acidithiobacillus sp.]|nr:hypothetical protein [Acidithiobacillus sp.]
MKKQHGKWDVRLAVFTVVLGALPFTGIAHATTGSSASASGVNASQALPSAAPAEAPILTQHVLQMIKEHRLV